MNTKTTTRAVIMKLVLLTFLVVLEAGPARAANILKLEGTTPISLRPGGGVTRKLLNVPPKSVGKFKLRIQWFTVHVNPQTKSLLRFQLLHGNKIVDNRVCYSSSLPLCAYTVEVNSAEAKAPGDWKLRIKNESRYSIRELDIDKRNYPTPGFLRAASKFERSCIAHSDIRIKPKPFWLTPGMTRIGTLETPRIPEGIGKGKIFLKAKWHASSTYPVFNKLKIELLKPNGQVAKSGYYYSYHAADKSPKFNITYDVSQSDGALTGSWRLKVTNYSGFHTYGLDVEKGTDSKVSFFTSRFNNACGS